MGSKVSWWLLTGASMNLRILLGWTGVDIPYELGHPVEAGRGWDWRGVIFKDAPVPADEKALLLLLSWCRQVRMILSLLQDVVLRVHRLFLLVRLTKEVILPEVILIVQNIILVVSHPEAGIKLRGSLANH